MSQSLTSLGLVHHALDMSRGQTCTHAMVSLSVTWLQKIEAMGHDTLTATNIGKSFVLHIHIEKLYTIEVLGD
jgi:hypothetical protein